MATIHRTRIAAIGCEEDMLRLCRVMLENVDRYEEPEERPPYTLEELTMRSDSVLRGRKATAAASCTAW